jgi:hypothetical protein
MTEEELAAIRSWVGPGPTDEALEEAYARLGSFDAVVEEMLRVQYTDLISQPSSLSVPGLSISNGQNLTALENLYKRFKNQGGTGLDDPDTTPGPGVYHLVRQDLR